MPRNIEIKARVASRAETRALVAPLAGAPPLRLVQEDIFFECPGGRLKLRVFGEGGNAEDAASSGQSAPSGQLIFYQRADAFGPKASHYLIAPTDRPSELRAVLQAAYGVRAVVHKTRWLYLVGRTRVHLDEVARLGEFVELEVVLTEGEDPAAGHAEADALMKALQIAPAQLIATAYVDMMPS